MDIDWVQLPHFGLCFTGMKYGDKLRNHHLSKEASALVEANLFLYTVV